MRHVIRIHNGDFFFQPEVLREAKIQPHDSNTALIHLNPDQFLHLARPGSSVEKMDRTLTLLNQGVKYNQLPYLRCFTNANGNLVVIGNGRAHEGRHRVRVLRSLGVTHIPVRIISEPDKGPPYFWANSKRRPRYLIGYNTYRVNFPTVDSLYMDDD